MKKLLLFVVDKVVLLCVVVVIFMLSWPLFMWLYSSVMHWPHRWTTVYHVLPVFHIMDVECVYTDGRLSVRAATIGNVVYFAPDNYNDSDVIKHENTHVKQFYRSLGLSYLVLNRFSDTYRAMYEYEAYKAMDEKFSDEEIATMVALTPKTENLPIEQFDAIKDKYLAIIKAHE